MLDCFEMLVTECLVSATKSLTDLLGDDLLDLGVDQLIVDLVKQMSMLESLGFFDDSIWSKLLVTSLVSDFGVTRASSQFLLDFNFRGFSAFCRGFIDHFNEDLPDSLLAIPHKVCAADNTLGHGLSVM